MDWGLILQASLAALTIGSMAAVGFTYGTVNRLRARVTDAESGYAQMKSERDEERTERARERAEDRSLIDQQAAKITVLEGVVTGEAHWAALTSMLSGHHEAAMAHWEAAEETMTKIAVALAAFPKEET